MEECEKRGHINFMPSGTIDVHSNHEETCISNEAHGARLTVVHEETNDLEDSHGPISCDLTDLPTGATVRIYKDGSIRVQACDTQKNPKSEVLLLNTGECHLKNIVTDAYIEITDDEKVTVHSDEEIVKNWEIIKKKEKERKTILDGIPPTLPLLARCQKVIEKLRRSKSSLVSESSPKEITEAEIGQCLWSLVATAQGSGIDAEGALRRYCNHIESEYRKKNTGE